MAKKDRIEHAYPFELYAPGTLTLDGVKLAKKVNEETYEQQVGELQRRVYALQIENFQKRRQAIVVFEGWDAAGKGGAIKRLTALMDPRGYKVWPIAAPRDAEPRHHYLWRFWERLPERGELAVFDRSWYGRVLVERVEGLASKAEWRRAYDEINAFERMLTDDGVRMLKLFLHIDRKTQLQRFERRETDPLRKYKLSDEDWRNRKRWKQYAKAIQEMLDRTHRPDAPWKVIPGDDKRFARLEVLRAVIALLE
ncbi:MAG TPA: polyphosphate kinase [Anaeromyxobacteraceae bacterium]|jgi:polyphosphate kinase 2 (PPK2 family)|nr:polyphosphate kinase [Anaeromyxobacteraceae bacterium]